ncbi:MAG: zinc-ribbon domain-containing protein [Rhodobacteraceae bacterium]|nr:zinc-ribbon domain-containing protein [Paracoccaceae bacterium]
MLIQCPNCNAQYEVPNDIIPATGRDVQCSSCSKTWFVTSLSDKKSTKDKVSKYESLEKGNLSKFETTESFLTDKSNKEVDRDVLEILREEADREIQARLRDGDVEDTTKKLSNKRVINKKVLPDNIEIGTTLDEAPDTSFTVTDPSKSKITSGKIGFIIGLVIIVLCWAIYTYDASITQSVPQTAMYIDIFKGYLDSVQIARDDFIKYLIQAIID